MKTVTEAQYRKANANGLRDAKTGDFTSYYTPALQVAYNLGQEGISLENAPVVTGYRYGEMPWNGVSANSQTGGFEKGLSLACVEGGKEVGSSVWFCDREKYTYTGIVSGLGSDGEVVILTFAAEYLD